VDDHIIIHIIWHLKCVWPDCEQWRSARS